MAYKMLYTCDKCGDTSESSVQFWTIGITANCSVFASNQMVADKSLNVCRPCLESFGVHVIVRKDEPVKETPTIEQAIVEIIQRCVAIEMAGH